MRSDPARCRYCDGLLGLDAVGQFCSRAHRDAQRVCREWQAKVRLVMTTAPLHLRECAECGEPFSIQRSTARFCGGACRVRHHRRNSAS